MALILSAAGEIRAEVVTDNFDDGTYSGWTVGDLFGHVYGPPRFVDSPEGYAISGIPDVGLPECQTQLHHSLSFQSMEMVMEMRSQSGDFPSNAGLVLTGSDPNGHRYELIDYGEFQRVTFMARDGGDLECEYSYNIPDWTSAWRTLQACRDEQGRWSLIIDGVNVAPNFYQDGLLTDFRLLGMNASGPDAYIESVTVTPEPATLSLLALGGLAVLRRRRR